MLLFLLSGVARFLCSGLGFQSGGRPALRMSGSGGFAGVVGVWGDVGTGFYEMVILRRGGVVGDTVKASQ